MNLCRVLSWDSSSQSGLRRRLSLFLQALLFLPSHFFSLSFAFFLSFSLLSDNDLTTRARALLQTPWHLSTQVDNNAAANPASQPDCLTVTSLYLPTYQPTYSPIFFTSLTLPLLERDLLRRLGISTSFSFSSLWVIY